MKDFTSVCLRSRNGKLEVLDQRHLPHQESWIEIHKVSDMVQAIQSLAIRGAPAIGVAAAWALAHSAEQGHSHSQLALESKTLRESRPTAVNLMAALDRMDQRIEKMASALELSQEAEQIHQEDVELCDRISRNGSPLLKSHDGVLTHCNTGGLATAGCGTALGVIQRAHNEGKEIHVFVDETRPLLQGGRLTAWECARAGIPHTLITDNMAAWQMAQGRVHKVIVGADRIAMNGDFANKIGTYNLAILCQYHGIPFYVAAPHTTLDRHCLSGKSIPIEQREAREVRGVHGAFGSVEWAPAQAPVDNPAFDVTPAELVTGWILDSGVYDFKAVNEGALKELAPQGGTK